MHLYNEITFKYVYIRASTRPTEITTVLTQDYLSTDIQLRWYKWSKQALDSSLYHHTQTYCDSDTYALFLGPVYLRDMWLP